MVLRIPHALKRAEVAKWTTAPVLKTGSANALREFESPPQRSNSSPTLTLLSSNKLRDLKTVKECKYMDIQLYDYPKRISSIEKNILETSYPDKNKELIFVLVVIIFCGVLLPEARCIIRALLASIFHNQKRFFHPKS